MSALQFKDLLISFTSEFLPLWNDQGSGAHKAVSLWRPSTTADALARFFPMGDIATDSYRNINQRKVVAVVSDANGTGGTALRSPDDYELVWKDTDSGARADFSIWRPLAPEGYVEMGLVCGVGYEKPSRNAVRCVRADLVVSAQPGPMIWNDYGSGASKDFSAWSIIPPDALPGEIYLAPGTFIGNARYTKPDRPTYALRMAFTLQLAQPLAPPVLTGYERPTEEETPQTTQVCELPWFCVKDPELSATEQLLSSPTYHLIRTDRHVLTGFGNNTNDTSQPFMWTAAKGEVANYSLALAAISRITLWNSWSASIRLFELSFSANLDPAFTHTQRSSKGWLHSSAVEIITYIPAKKAVAAYLIQSEYRLLRQDGSQLASTVSYTNGDNVYISEFPGDKPISSEQPFVEPTPALPALEVSGHDLVDKPLTP
ncbi:Vps62-related protein [Pseudomonas sp. HN11]|uniref:Vps62-related protein n=1 Tax=Pseudomonas sp. HN11 TaxID=1344094 RepID=UPI001F344A0F|nr:Vps62-related protein [Pseudomonas sp. HN11]UII71894.1 Vps62-related protein [Pseudomonas sp. HN11]